MDPLDPIMERFPRQICCATAITIGVGSWVALYLVSQNAMIIWLPGPQFEILRIVSYARLLAYIPRPWLLLHLMRKLWSAKDAEDPLLELRRIMGSCAARANRYLSYVVQIWVVVVFLRLLFFWGGGFGLPSARPSRSDLPDLPYTRVHGSIHSAPVGGGGGQVVTPSSAPLQSVEHLEKGLVRDASIDLMESLSEAMWSHWKLVVANRVLSSLGNSLLFCYLIRLRGEEDMDIISMPYLLRHTTTRVLGPSAIEPVVADNKECAICFQDYEDGDSVRTLQCTHEFHVSCIDPWLMGKRNACPLCNARVGRTKND